MTDKQLKANRRNALRSTGPKTGEGIQACKGNALRHGLRALQTVVPGETHEEWEAHRETVVADLDPQGAVELALAEQTAAKLWRLGRVVRHEADLITNAQDEDEILHAHERAHERGGYFSTVKRTDIPKRADVEDAAREAEKAEKKLADRDEALRDLETLTTMKDEDAFESWTLYEVLRDDCRLDEAALERLFKEEDTGPFLARHARKMLGILGGKSGDLDEMREALAVAWAEQRLHLEKNARRLRARHKMLAHRYRAALERRRRANGLPGPEALDKIQRYEAHLERGLHKALDRLHDLQEARGAVPPRGPSVALAVVQAGAEKSLAGQMGPFGSFALEATDQVQEPAGVDAGGTDND